MIGIAALNRILQVIAFFNGLSAPLGQQRAEQPAHQLATEMVGRLPGRTLLGFAGDAAEHFAEAAFIGPGCGFSHHFRRLFGSRLTGASKQHFIGRFAIKRPIVAPGLR